MKKHIQEIDITEYHKLKHISSTTLKAALKSPRSYHNVIRGLFSDSDAKALGDAVHAYILEPERFYDMYERKETKKGEGYLSPISDVRKITPAQYEKFNSMVNALENSDEATNIIAKSTAIEETFICELGGTGETFKVRPDAIAENVDNDGDIWIVDLKTAGGMDDNPSKPEVFSRTFWDLMYDVQMVLYTKVVETVLERPVTGFIFIVVDAKKEDSGVKIYKFKRGQGLWWKIGAARCKEAIENVKKYKELTEFPVFDKEIETELPLSYQATEYSVRKEIQ